MEKLSRSVPKKPYNGGGSSYSKSPYDDVISGGGGGALSRFAGGDSSAVSLSPRIEDYAEIFGGSRAPRGATSIPVLDLPAVDVQLSLCFQGTRFDYSEVFGGSDGGDYAMLFEELMGNSESAAAACDSSDEAWTPAQSETLSDESEPYACSERYQSMSNGELYHSSEGIKQFKISYNKAYHTSTDDVANGMGHVTQLYDVPGYSILINEVPPSQKIMVTENLNQSEDFSRGLGEGKRLRKTSSCNNKPFVTISDISLRTQPSQLPPPSRPPPVLGLKDEVSDIQSSKLKASKTFTFGETISDDITPPFYDVEVDASSSAAVSAAAMKDAMEKAQAKLKSAKHMKERNKEGLQSHKSSGFKSIVESNCFKDERACETSKKDYDGVKAFAVVEKEKLTVRSEEVSDLIDGEEIFNVARVHRAKKNGKERESFQGSCKMEGNVAWRQDAEFFEVVETDESREFINLEDDHKAVVQNIQNHAQGQEKIANADVWQQRGYQRKMSEIHEKIIVEAVKDEEFKNMAKVPKKENVMVVEDEHRYKDEFGKEENENRSKGTVERERYDNRLKEATEKAKSGKRLKEALEREEREKKQREACEREERQKREKEAREKELEEKRVREAVEHEEKEKQLKEARARYEKEKKETEARERADKEKREKEAQEREEKEATEKAKSGKRLKEALEREEREKKQREACEREERQKREKEAREKELEEKRVREAVEHEEKEKQLKEARARYEKEKKETEARERADKEKREKEAQEREEKEKREKVACDRELEEKRYREAVEEEEKEKKQQEACQKEEKEKREEEAREREIEEGRLKEDIEQEEKEKRLEIALEQEENEKKKTKSCQRNEAEKLLAEDLRWRDIEEKPSHNLQKGEKVLDPKEACQRVDNLERPTVASEREETKDKLKGGFGGLKLDEDMEPLQENLEREDQGKRLREAFKAEDIDKMWEEDYVLENNNKTKENSVCHNQEQVKENRGMTYMPIGVETQVEKSISFGMARDNLQHEKKEVGRKESKESLCMHDTVTEFDKKPSKISHNSCKLKTINHEFEERGNNSNKVPLGKEERYENSRSSQEVKECRESGRKMGADAPKASISQNPERKGKKPNVLTQEGREKEECLSKERELEIDRQRKIEEERDREREREKDRMAVDLASLERAAVERATFEARKRALSEARERQEKASVEARLRAERAAVERATAEARERAFQKAKAENYTVDARERVVKVRQSSLHTDSCQGVGSSNQPTHSYSSVNGGVEGESVQRCKARLDRHRRTAERAAKALEEKNMRDLIVQRELAERNRLAESLDAEVKRWSSGKQGNLRALLSTLQYILGADSGWQPIPLTEVITSAAVKRAYRKATLYVHPDKLQQRGATIHQKYICEKVFDLLKEAWNKFNSEER